MLVRNNHQNYSDDSFPESMLIDHPGVRYHPKIRRSGENDPERAAYVEAAVARILLKRLTVRSPDDLKDAG